jgi:hypothetical protein
MVQPYSPDPEFENHFKHLHQIFMYITDRCNLECEQCIYKPSISHFINEEIALDDALDLLATFRHMGATKVTFLGGEPTLYGHREGGRPLLDLVAGTKLLGFPICPPRHERAEDQILPRRGGLPAVGRDRVQPRRLLARDQ